MDRVAGRRGPDSFLTQALQEVCPHCGERYLAYLDILGGELEYTACCDHGRFAVEQSGFFDGLTHRQRKKLIAHAFERDCRLVHADHETWTLLDELQVVTTPQRLAFDLIRQHHRHHQPPAGWKFGFGVQCGSALVGICVVGRPVSRQLQARGDTWEVTRTCTWGWPKCLHVQSLMYAEAARRAKRLGVSHLVTYTLLDEPGTSLIAAGWEKGGISKGGSWNRANRPRQDKAPTGPKQIWTIVLGQSSGNCPVTQLLGGRGRVHGASCPVGSLF